MQNKKIEKFIVKAAGSLKIDKPLTRLTKEKRLK